MGKLVKLLRLKTGFQSELDDEELYYKFLDVTNQYTGSIEEKKKFLEYVDCYKKDEIDIFDIPNSISNIMTYNRKEIDYQLINYHHKIDTSENGNSYVLLSDDRKLMQIVSKRKFYIRLNISYPIHISDITSCELLIDDTLVEKNWKCG